MRFGTTPGGLSAGRVGRTLGRLSPTQARPAGLGSIPGKGSRRATQGGLGVSPQGCLPWLLALALQREGRFGRVGRLGLAQLLLRARALSRHRAVLGGLVPSSTSPSRAGGFIAEAARSSATFPGGRGRQVGALQPACRPAGRALGVPAVRLFGFPPSPPRTPAGRRGETRVGVRWNASADRKRAISGRA